MKFLIIYSFFSLFLIACSASTGSRYEKKDETKTEAGTSVNTKEVEVVEDFDISPYQTEINLEAPPLEIEKLPSDVWFGYEDSSAYPERIIIGTTDGYRVQVLSTDNLDEANRVRAEIYEKTVRKEVYVTFEPPFYKVKAGDFTSQSEANDLKFLLTQLGYTEAKVVQETVNLFE